MELRHGAHAAADSVSAVFQQWTTTPLSFAVSKWPSHLPPLLISSSLFLQSAAQDIYCCRGIANSMLLFLLPPSCTVSITVPLCSYGSFCFSFCSNHFLSLLLLQFPVDSYNEYMVLLPCSRFFLRVACGSAVAKGA